MSANHLRTAHHATKTAEDAKADHALRTPSVHQATASITSAGRTHTTAETITAIHHMKTALHAPQTVGSVLKMEYVVLPGRFLYLQIRNLPQTSALLVHKVQLLYIEANIGVGIVLE